MSRVLKLCRRPPLTKVSMSILAGSSSPTTMHGPIEWQLSKFLPRLNLSGAGFSGKSRALQSMNSVTPQMYERASAARMFLPRLPRMMAQLALVVELRHARGIDHRAVGIDGVAIDLPASPHAAVAGIGRGARVRPAAVYRHGGAVGGEIAAGESNARARRARRAQAKLRDFACQRLAAEAVAVRRARRTDNRRLPGRGRACACRPR